MSSKGVTPGTTTVQQKQGAWTPAPPQRFRQRRTRLTPGATLADVVTAFNQQADELERVTASARDIASARTLYAGVAFVSGVVQRFAHKLGSANVSMSHSSPRATPGVTAGNPWVIWQVDPKNPDLVIVSPAGTFTCDLEFRVAPPFAGAATLGPTGGFTPPSGTGAVVSVNGVESVAAGTTGQVLTSTGPTTAPTFQTVAAGGGWQNATLGVNGTMDFRLQTTQTLSPDGNYTIGGTVFVKAVSAGDATAMVLTNGVGIVMKPALNTQFYTTRTAPMLLLNLASVIPNFSISTVVEISAYWSSQNVAADFDEAFIGTDSGSAATQATNWRAGLAHNSSLGQQLVVTWSGAGIGGVPQTTAGTSDVVEVLTLPDGMSQLTGSLSSTSSAYSGGIWPDSNLVLRCNMNAQGNGANAVSGNVTVSAFSAAWGAQRQGSATALSCTLAAIRVRYKA